MKTSHDVIYNNAVILDRLPSSEVESIKLLRSSSLAKVIEQGFPSSKEDSWAYTKFAPKDFQELMPLDITSNRIESITSHAFREEYSIILDSNTIEISKCLLNDASIKIQDLSEIFACKVKAEYFLQLLQHTDAFNDLFIPLLNLACCKNGVVIDIASNTNIEQVINIFYKDISLQGPQYFHVLINVGVGSNVRILEHFMSSNHSDVIYNTVLRVQLGEEASLQHYKICDLPENTKHYSASKINLCKNSSYNGFMLNTGSGESRYEVHTDIFENAHCSASGLSLIRNYQHQDIYLNFHHKGPGGVSNQSFKQVLDNYAKGVFYGQIVIEERCFKVEATQDHFSLLLSDDAQAFSRPTLDILADDVKCVHASSIGGLDEEALYYLRTRGLDIKQATHLLLDGFISDILCKVTHKTVHDLIRDKTIYWLNTYAYK